MTKLVRYRILCDDPYTPPCEVKYRVQKRHWWGWGWLKGANYHWWEHMTWIRTFSTHEAANAAIEEDQEVELAAVRKKWHKKWHVVELVLSAKL